MAERPRFADDLGVWQGTISSLADHTNPEVRAAARRVQSMYTDS